MKLYHYTAVSMAETILSKGLREGHIKHGDGSMRKQDGWLTTDPHAEGHGLLTGKEQPTDSQLRYMERVQGALPLNGIMFNKTRIRLTFDVPSDSATLMPFVEYYAMRGEKPEEAKLMGLSAYVHNPWQMPAAQRRQLVKTMTTKEQTWWLSFAPVPASAITAVDYNSREGFVPYDFETHGRRPFRDAGLVAPSAATLATLRTLVPTTLPFEVPKAFAFCHNLKHAPAVIVRGGGVDTCFELATGALLFGTTHPNSAALAAWVRGHAAELQSCWEEAIEVYHAYHTQRAPSQGRPDLWP